ncbi:MAG TPA: NUDIX hydrolase [Rhizomicrobium sp.]|nr:NUDIX hydrolase [Rhizomicrobium sp.]
MTAPVFDPDDEKIVAGALRPKDAATLILVKREADAPRVLMGRRHHGMAFMAGKYVFPGGRVDPGDQRVLVSSDLRPDVLAKLTTGISPARAKGLALAAVRETFEETGIVLGERAERIPRTKTQAWKRFFAHGLMPRLDRFEFIARAITPPNRTRRFDARFFMADASEIGHTLDSAETDELLEACWLTFDEARAQDLPSITRRMIDEVEERVRKPDEMRPVPFFRFRNNKPSLDYL